MRGWPPERVAQAAGARLDWAPDHRAGPRRVVIDSRHVQPGDLFVGLRGQREDGGRFAADALSAGAWGVMVGSEHAGGARGAEGTWMSSDDPLAALQRLAGAWRRALGAKVVGITGSTGKTSTKDILAALLAPHRRTLASQANFNTEIGLPLEILRAPGDTDVLVLEMAMRGTGQIAELAAIAQPDVAVIVNVGPVHLELLGTLEAIAAAKAELIAGLQDGGIVVVPAGEPLLERHLRPELSTVRFGDGGDVALRSVEGERLLIDAGSTRIELEVTFTQAHLRRNLLAAVAAALAVGVVPGGRLELAPSPGRGGRERLAQGVTLIDDSYNANPMSVRAALEDLAVAVPEAAGRRVAVLGDMLELGPDAADYHREVGAVAGACPVDVLVAVGALAAHMADEYPGEVHRVPDARQASDLVASLVRPGDVVLVKGSRAVGLEVVCRALRPEVAA